jgi:hypothetical protein
MRALPPCEVICRDQKGRSQGDQSPQTMLSARTPRPVHSATAIECGRVSRVSLLTNRARRARAAKAFPSGVSCDNRHMHAPLPPLTVLSCSAVPLGPSPDGGRAPVSPPCPPAPDLLNEGREKEGRAGRAKAEERGEGEGEGAESWDWDARAGRLVGAEVEEARRTAEDCPWFRMASRFVSSALARAR